MPQYIFTLLGYFQATQDATAVLQGYPKLEELLVKALVQNENWYLRLHCSKGFASLLTDQNASPESRL